ncbi:hypothetical protein [Corynebacterium otitidis]
MAPGPTMGKYVSGSMNHSIPKTTATAPNAPITVARSTSKPPKKTSAAGPSREKNSPAAMVMGPMIPVWRSKRLIAALWASGAIAGVEVMVRCSVLGVGRQRRGGRLKG